MDIGYMMVQCQCCFVLIKNPRYDLVMLPTDQAPSQERPNLSAELETRILSKCTGDCLGATSHREPQSWE